MTGDSLSGFFFMAPLALTECRRFGEVAFVFEPAPVLV